MLWDTHTGKPLRTLEGHTSYIDIVAFSSDGRLLVSKSADHTIRLWNCETWETVAVIPATSDDNTSASRDRPSPHVAAAGRPPQGTGTPDDERSRQIYLWELDYDVLLGKRTDRPRPLVRSITRPERSCWWVITAWANRRLGHRLIHGVFKEQASTHGQQFWVFPALGKRREDGTECEAILWDFAGQPDYRLGPCALRG